MDQHFKKSTKSESLGACVEICLVRDECVLRDSKNPAGPAMRPAIRGWLAFLGTVKTGEIDRPR